MKNVYVVLMTLLFTVSCNKDAETDIKALATDYLENCELFDCVPCFSVIYIHARSGFVIRDENTYKLC
jgi:hypothetical protein